MFSCRNEKTIMWLPSLIWAMHTCPKISSPFMFVIVLPLFVLRFYGPVNPMRSCRARSVYLTTRLLGRLSPLSG